MLILVGGAIGILSGLLGVGGGFVLVPALIALKYLPIQAVATSSLVTLMTSLSGSLYNWKKNSFAWKDLFCMALPCLMMAQFGVWLAGFLSPAWLLFLFGILLWCALILLALQNLLQKVDAKDQSNKFGSFIMVGCIAGFFAGLFGVGGGVILVPLQMLLLAQDFKTSVKNSLAVVVFASLFASISHGLAGNIVFVDGLFLSVGGITGALLGSHLLPKANAKHMRLSFMALLMALTAYVLFKAYRSPH